MSLQQDPAHPRESRQGASYGVVLVVQDDEQSLRGYRTLLSGWSRIARCVVTTQRGEALALAGRHRPEIALIDMGPFAGGLVEGLRGIDPRITLILRARCEVSAAAARQLGAAATLTFDATSREILAAIRDASDRASSEPRPREEDPAGELPDFNERERAVMELLMTGATNREIAEQLYLSVESIKKYAARIYRKLGVRNRTEAVARLRQPVPT